jgi:glycosyltransferase involved in cell wall biosynthesis
MSAPGEAPRRAPEATVCILLPTYNDARHLGETIRSVLDQTYRDFRLVILDNASDDDTADVVAGFDDPRIEYRRHPRNLGFLGNLNAGFALADGRYVAVQNSDDLWAPDFLRACVDALEADPRLAAVHTAATWIDAAGDPFGASPEGWPPVCEPAEAFLHVLDIGFTFAAAMFRTEVIRGVTPLSDPAFARIADTELMLRTCLQGPVGYIARPLCLYRVHDASLSLKMYHSGEFFRLHLAATMRAFEWPETAAAGLAPLRGRAASAVAMQSLRMLHLGREANGVGAFLGAYAGIVRAAPQVLARPEAWARLGLGLLPYAAILRLRGWRRARAKRRDGGGGGGGGRKPA